MMMSDVVRMLASEDSTCSNLGSGQSMHSYCNLGGLVHMRMCIDLSQDRGDCS